MKYHPAYYYLGVSTLNLAALLWSSPGCADGHRWTLWWQNQSGQVARWDMSGTDKLGSSVLDTTGVNSGWHVVGSGNFSGETNSEDIVWQHDGGTVSVWCTDGTNCTDQLKSPSLNPGWEIRATGDMTGNGSTDLVCEHTNGWLGITPSSGGTGTQQYLEPSKVDPTWKLAGTSDVNGDGRPDVIFQNSDGRLAVWYMNGTKRTHSSYLNPARVDPSWKLVGAYDLNGDGKKELIWHNQKDGRVSYWEMDGTNRVGGGPLTPSVVDPSWQIVGPH